MNVCVELTRFASPNFDSNEDARLVGVSYTDTLEPLLQTGLTAQRIYQDLVGDHGYAGSYDTVKRFVRQLRQIQPVPFMRLEVDSRQEAQVDFGQGAWVWVNSRRKRPHLFRVVLSHSRKAYSEVVWHQRPRVLSAVWRMRSATLAGCPARWSATTCGRGAF